MRSETVARSGLLALCAGIAALALTSCSKPKDEAPSDTATTASADTSAASAPAAVAPVAAPAPDNTDTTDGTKFASFTGDAAKGKVAFITCQTCHTTEAGVNKIGPSLHEVVGRHAGTIAGYSYTPANKNSGITWTPEKLFQYLENPQRVVPGTKMAFAGFPEAQKRADVIAYLQSNP